MIFKAAKVPINWELQEINHKEVDKRTNSFITVENLESVKVSNIKIWSSVSIFCLNMNFVLLCST